MNRTEIQAAVERLPRQLESAIVAAAEVHRTVDQLDRLNDPVLFGDCADGEDLLDETNEALRHLRNARRIAEARAATGGES